MASIETSVARTAAASMPESSDWEKDFFTTWLRLMERQKDAVYLTHALQSLLAQSGDTVAKLQDAKHHTNMMSANDKTMTELVALLNEFFFRDIVPALKRARHTETTGAATQQQQQDPLDRYLEHGDEGTAMPQAFVDDMSGWEAPARAVGQETEQSNSQKKKKKKKARRKSFTLRALGEEGGDTGSEDDLDSDDEIPSEMFHDMLIANSLKLTAMQAPDYSTVVPGHVVQQQFAAAPNAMVAQGVAARMSSPSSAGAGARTIAYSSTTASPRVTKGKSKVKKTNKRDRVVPSPIVTDIPPRSGSVSGSTPRTQSQSPAETARRKDRIGKKTAASLVAEQVEGVRTYGSAKEFLIRWQDVAVPLWIARRKAPPQAKELIDLYAAALRMRDSMPAAQGQTQGVSPNGRKKSSRDGTSMQDAVTGGSSGAKGAKFYTVDHIVNHRVFYNRRQYLVRWENYDKSEDTWENADKLRVDVPDIVDAYEQQLQRGHARAEAVQSAMSELIRDSIAGSKSTTKKRSIGRAGSEDTADKSKSKLPVSGNGVDGQQPKEKRRRIATDKEGRSNDSDGGNTSKDDHQFHMEEAELEEFSANEFADKLGN